MKNLKQYAWIFSGIGTAIIVALYEYFKSSQSGILAPIAIGTAIVLIYIVLSQIVSFLKRKDFFSYFKAKVKELLYLMLEDKKTYIESSDKFNVFALHEKMLVLADSVNRFKWGMHLTAPTTIISRMNGNKATTSSVRCHDVHTPLGSFASIREFMRIIRLWLEDITKK